MPEANGMFAAALAAFERSDISEDISSIKVATLVMTGRDDPAATPAQAEFITTHIPGAVGTIIHDASHLAGIEKPLKIAGLVRAFLTKTA